MVYTRNLKTEVGSRKRNGPRKQQGRLWYQNTPGMQKKSKAKKSEIVSG